MVNKFGGNTMNTHIQIRIDEKLKVAVNKLAKENDLNVSDYIRNLIKFEVKKENEKMVKIIVNVNIDGVNEVYEVNKATKYSDITNIIHHRLDDSKLAIRSTEDCDINTLINNLDVEWFEFEDDVLYIR